MLFWTVAALLTLIASLAVLWPLVRRTATAAAPRNEIEVYRDQLAEVGRDLGRGLLSAEEAEQARAEIGRRIIKADAATNSLAQRGRFAGVAKYAATVGVLSVPLVSWGLYSAIGSPQLPSQPLAARLSNDAANGSIEELIARAEAQLAANPDDLRGWEILAPIYVRLNRFDDAVSAYRNAIRLGGQTAAREAGLGEALVYMAGGLVTAEATAAFENAMKLEPEYPKSRFFLAMAKGQDGKREDAIADWKALATGLPQGDPWSEAAKSMLASVTQPAAPTNQAPTNPAPTNPAPTNVAPGAEQPAMIEQMVSSLDQKLRENPQDAEGWKRLVRSYVVLGREDAARDALSRALAALGADSAAGKDVGDFAAGQGVRVE